MYPRETQTVDQVIAAVPVNAMVDVKSQTEDKTMPNATEEIHITYYLEPRGEESTFVQLLRKSQIWSKNFFNIKKIVVIE